MSALTSHFRGGAAGERQLREWLARGIAKRHWQAVGQAANHERELVVAGIVHYPSGCIDTH